MAVWIIPCNIQKYDVIGAFRHLQAVDWKQTIRAEVGDTVFIYASKPIGALIYKAKVNKTGLEKIEIDDAAYVLDGKNYLTSPLHMEIGLLDCFNLNRYSLEVLREHGVSGNIQGPQHAPDALVEYMRELGDL